MKAPDNLLTGSIPDFSAFTGLYALMFQQNFLTSTIPGASSFDATLDYLYVGDNFLTGALPDLGSIDFVGFSVEYNLLDAQPLPDWIFPNVYWYLSVAGNQFTGECVKREKLHISFQPPHILLTYF